MNRALREIVEVAAEGGAVPQHVRQRAQGLLARERVAKAQRRARSAPRRRAEAALDAQESAAWLAIREGVRARSGGRCEVTVAARRCTQRATECHHLWGGGGRRGELQSVEACLDVCASHHDLATLNKPTRSFWLAVYREHVLRHGLRSQLRTLEQAEALLEGKQRRRSR